MSIPSVNDDELDSIAKQIVKIFYPIGYVFDKFAELQHRLLGSSVEDKAIEKVLNEITDRSEANRKPTEDEVNNYIQNQFGNENY